MEQDKLITELFKEIDAFLDGLDEYDYFRIDVEKAIALNILPELVVNICMAFGIKKIFFNKYDFHYFQNLRTEDESIRHDLIEYAMEGFDSETTKLDWDGDLKIATEIYLTSFFLWFNHGIVFIEEDSFDYSKIKNEMIGKLFQFYEAKNVVGTILQETIKFLKNSRVGSHKLLYIDFKMIYDSYNDTKVNLSLKQKKNSSLPYQIALLNEVGFFDLERLKGLSKSKQYDLLAKLLNADSRSVKGNHAVLNPHSNENRTKFTSYNYMDEVKVYLNNL
nr:hypothetical protein [uncultured Allomuricauda sp.]